MGDEKCTGLRCHCAKPEGRATINWTIMLTLPLPQAMLNILVNTCGLHFEYITCVGDISTLSVTIHTIEFITSNNKRTNKIPPWSRVLFETLTFSQAVKKFPTFYKTRRLITVLTTANICSYHEPRVSSPHPSILLLYTHLNIILSPMLRSSKWHLPSDIKRKSSTHLSSAPFVPHAPPNSHSLF